MSRDYLPAAFPDLLVWYANFNVKFPLHALAFGFTPAEVTGVANDFLMLQFVVNGAEIFSAEAAERVAYRDILTKAPTGTVAPGVPDVPTLAPPAVIVAPGIIARIRAVVRLIKAKPNFTQAVGEDLKIIAPPGGSVIPPVKLKITPLVNSQVRIVFTKGKMGGLQLESKRGTETLWTILKVYTDSPILDVRPPLVANTPEVREYRGIYIKNNTAVGSYSDIVAIVTLP